MHADEGDVVCVGIVPTGQSVDWSPGSVEPDPAEWLSEAEFLEVLKAATKADTAVLPTLDFYSQNRIGRSDCARILASWNDLATLVEGTTAEAPAAAIHRIMRSCVDNADDVEVLIEGP